MSPGAAEPALTPELVVTNFNRNFTGVSATAAGVTRSLLARYRTMLAGVPLAGCPEPVGRIAALSASRVPPAGRPAVIWHVRRNSEMQWGLLARDVLRLPVRLVFTSAAQRRHSAWPRWLISRMDAVIATSEEAASLVPHVRAVIPHGVDAELFTPAEDRAALWRETGFPGTAGIAVIGRVRPEKGTDLFVEAMLRVLPANPGMVAVCFGAAHERDRGFEASLKDRAARADLGERIVFAGEISQERLARLLPAFSLLVAPPRYEGYGMTALEGMAAGVPFVATDTGAFRTFAEDGRCGEIVPVGDAEALGAAVSGWLADPSRLEAAAKAARQSVVAKHSVEMEANRVAEVLETVWAEAR